MAISDYNILEKAYGYFNDKLFENHLPEIIITFQRKPHCNGYFHFESFSGRNTNKIVSEIALNPDGFSEKTDLEILSTLVHEMVHCEECYFYDAPRKGYHSKTWSSIMEDIGLMPSSTGEPGGKKNGQKMSHYIIEDGKFSIIANAFLLNNKLEWQSFVKESEKKEKKKASRKKYVCPECHTNIWAKNDIRVACVDCGIQFVEEIADDGN